mmetsp:Transcript_20079/g.55281  ORF Transcript_20079/g.55281 Transcript_20079/m.55281 type:complete len:474 (-) Transcript_20079:194-1615(-)
MHQVGVLRFLVAVALAAALGCVPEAMPPPQAAIEVRDRCFGRAERLQRARSFVQDPRHRGLVLEVALVRLVRQTGQLCQVPGKYLRQLGLALTVQPATLRRQLEHRLALRLRRCGLGQQCGAAALAREAPGSAGVQGMPQPTRRSQALLSADVPHRYGEPVGVRGQNLVRDFLCGPEGEQAVPYGLDVALHLEAGPRGVKQAEATAIRRLPGLVEVKDEGEPAAIQPKRIVRVLHVACAGPWVHCKHCLVGKVDVLKSVGDFPTTLQTLNQCIHRLVQLLATKALRAIGKCHEVAPARGCQRPVQRLHPVALGAGVAADRPRRALRRARLHARPQVARGLLEEQRSTLRQEPVKDAEVFPLQRVGHRLVDVSVPPPESASRCFGARLAQRRKHVPVEPSRVRGSRHAQESEVLHLREEPHDILLAALQHGPARQQREDVAPHSRRGPTGKGSQHGLRSRGRPRVQPDCGELPR